jgi:hypothetical protein
MPGTPPGYSVASVNPTVGVVKNLCTAEFDTSTACKSAGWSICKQAISKLSDLTLSRVIKGSGTALYWYGKDGKRYIFPNEATFRTWFPIGSKCPIINQVTDAALEQIPLGQIPGGFVNARPGIKLIKLQGDPKIYAVSKNGVLRWIESGPEFNSIITEYYGQTWTDSVIELPDQFFIMYSMGEYITNASQYSPANASSSSPTIDIDKGL